MTPSTRLALLLLGLGAGSALTGWALRNARQAAEAELRRAAEVLRHAHAEVAALPGRRAQLQAELAALEAELARATAAPREQPAAPPPPSPRPDSLALLRNDPQLELLKLAARRSALRSQYRSLWQRLGLDPEQVAQFEDILERREAQIMDLQNSALEQGLAVNDAKLTPLWEALHRETEQAQKDLLGESGFREFQEYERTAALREVVEATAGAAAVAGAALTQAQAQGLLRVLEASQQGLPVGSVVMAASIDWGKVDALAATVLSAEQMRIFQSIEAMGARDMGGRHLPRLNFLIQQAQEREAAATAARGSTSSSDGSG